MNIISNAVNGVSATAVLTQAPQASLQISAAVCHALTENLDSMACFS